MFEKRTRLAVLGSPIAHSLSPVLHRAAYEVLGLPWHYEAIEVVPASLVHFVDSLDDSWRGLSLTMPLKREIIPLLTSTSDLVDQTGSANTVLLGHPVHLREGFNTDVYGITEAFVRHGRGTLQTVLLLGGGATAASAVAAAALLSTRRIFVGVRVPERARGLVNIGRALGVEVLVRPLVEIEQIDERLDAVISTLPGGVDTYPRFDPDTVQTATLLDVVYHPWPSPLASAWPGDEVISGLEMLVLQAMAQVRIFANDDPQAALAAESDVLAAMLAAAGL